MDGGRGAAVHLVFEIDRFRAVHAIEVPRDELGRAPAGLGTLPLTGPTLLSVRDFKDDRGALRYHF